MALHLRWVSLSSDFLSSIGSRAGLPICFAGGVGLNWRGRLPETAGATLRERD